MPVYLPDTTLLVHFFGRRGRDQLQYQDFHTYVSYVLSAKYQIFKKIILFFFNNKDTMYTHEVNFKIYICDGRS